MDNLIRRIKIGEWQAWSRTCMARARISGLAGNDGIQVSRGSKLGGAWKTQGFPLGKEYKVF